MKITSLGHGGAFAGQAVGNSSFLFEFVDDKNEAKRMLFDCGSLTPYILRDEMGINFHEVDAVYISHAHADHFGGLPLFLQSRYWIPKINELKERIVPIIFWDGEVQREIHGTLSIEVKHLIDENGFTFGAADVPDFARMFVVSEKAGFSFGMADFSLVKQKHIFYGNSWKTSTINPRLEEHWKPVYGLKFTYYGKRVLFTADTKDVADLGAYDIVFHDCETSVGFKSGVHAHYDDILEAYKKLDNKPEMYMVHYTNIPKNPHPDFKWFQKGQSIEIK